MTVAIEKASRAEIDAVVGMVRSIYEQCRQHGVRALHLEVERANASAQRLYQGLGFEVHGRTLMTEILN